MSVDVSVILVSYNTSSLTKNCLNSLYEKTSGVNFDVWVVDNNSQDDSCKMVKDNFPTVHLLENATNIGFGRANNVAIKQATGKYIFLLNTDTVLINNAIKIFFDYMENNQTVGAIGGNLYDSHNNNIHSYGHFQTFKRKLVKTFGLGWILKKEDLINNDKGQNEKNDLKEVDIIVGADLFIRKSVLDEVGYFDEDFFMYDEESELQFRIKKAGHKIIINPNAKIYHLEGKSSKKKSLARAYKMESEILFYKKCYGRKHLELYKFICCMPNLPRLIKNPIMIIKIFKKIRRI